MDISTIDTSVPRARQLRDEPQSGRYPTRGYQQRQPSLKRTAADQTDLTNEEHGTRLRKGLTTVRQGGICPFDRTQPYQRLGFSRGGPMIIRPPPAATEVSRPQTMRHSILGNRKYLPLVTRVIAPLVRP